MSECKYSMVLPCYMTGIGSQNIVQQDLKNIWHIITTTKEGPAKPYITPHFCLCEQNIIYNACSQSTAKLVMIKYSDKEFFLISYAKQTQ